MSVVAVLLALLLEQARPSLPMARARAVYGQWLEWTSRNFDAGSSRHAIVVWGLGVLLPAVGVAAVGMALASFSVVLSFVWHVGVLYLTIGFRQFSHHFTAIRDALDQGDETRARQLLAQWQGIDASELPRTELLRQVIEYAILASHRLVFGVMFWYVLLAAVGLGPAGAVLYRLAHLAVQHWAQRHPVDGEPLNPNVLSVAERLWRLIDHVPARLSAFGFAIVGNFEESIAAWRRDAGIWAEANDGVVLAAAAGAIGVQLGQAPAAPARSPQARSPASPTGRRALALPVETAVPPMVDGSPDSLGEGIADGPGEPAASDSVPPAGLTAGTPPLPGHLQSLVGLVWRSTILWVLLLALLSVANLLG